MLGSGVGVASGSIVTSGVGVASGSVVASGVALGDGTASGSSIVVTFRMRYTSSISSDASSFSTHPKFA